jgi:AraC-like DNA-binding protein
LEWAAQTAARRKQLLALPGMTLAAASGFSSLSISAAAFALGLGSTSCCSFHLGRCFGSRLGKHRLLLGALQLHAADLQLLAQTGVTLAAASGFSSLSISAAAFVLGLGSTGCCLASTQLIALTGVTIV